VAAVQPAERNQPLPKQSQVKGHGLVLQAPYGLFPPALPGAGARSTQSTLAGEPSFGVPADVGWADLEPRWPGPRTAPSVAPAQMSSPRHPVQRPRGSGRSPGSQDSRAGAVRPEAGAPQWRARTPVLAPRSGSGVLSPADLNRSNEACRLFAQQLGVVETIPS
jgi:hypothetical protein